MRHITNCQGSKYSDVQRREAVFHYAITGNLQKVSELTGIPDNTIGTWKNHSDWWDVLLEEVRDEIDDEIDGMYLGLVKKAGEKAMASIENCDKPLELTKVSAIAFDKLRLVRNLPTSIRSENTEALLEKLADRFKDMSQGRVIEGERIE